MINSIALVAVAFLCLVAFPTTTLGKILINFQRLRDLSDTSRKSTTFRTYWTRVDKWPSPSDISKNQIYFANSNVKLNYGDSKVWKCTYSNGSTPAVSISYPIPVTPSIPSTPSPSSPKTSPPPPTPKPSPPPPTPKASPPPSTLKTSPPPSTPKTSPSPPAPKKSPPPPTPKASPPPLTPKPSLPPPTPKTSAVPSTPSLPPPMSPTPSNPPPEHHHSPIHHHYENPWEHIEHIERCMVNMGHAAMCRMQMEATFYTRMFRVCKECCDFIVNMKDECEDVVWGFFTDPFFVPLVRNTCHVTY